MNAVAYVQSADALAATVCGRRDDIAAVLRDVQTGRLIIADADAIAATSLRDVIAETLPEGLLNRPGLAVALAYAVTRWLGTTAGQRLARECAPTNTRGEL